MNRLNGRGVRPVGRFGAWTPHVPALERQLELLEGVAASGLELDCWVRWIPLDESRYMPRQAIAAACACGLAMYDPWFNEQGFVPDRWGDPHAVPKFHYHHSLEAVQRFFRLTERQSVWLYLTDSYHWQRTAGQRRVVPVRLVRERIAGFINEIKGAQNV